MQHKEIKINYPTVGQRKISLRLRENLDEFCLSLRRNPSFKFESAASVCKLQVGKPKFAVLI